MSGHAWVVFDDDDPIGEFRPQGPRRTRRERRAALRAAETRAREFADRRGGTSVELYTTHGSQR